MNCPSESIPTRIPREERADRQDAELAMANDPTRAFVELITNCDDAYGENDGKILIELQRRAKDDWAFVVRDRACGMNQRDMETKLLRAGGRVSGFEKGEKVRGNLGRGGKDVSIFGQATFESIKDNRYTRCEMYRAATYDFVQPERDATSQDRNRLGIPRGNGTIVTITVSNSARCPQIGTLKRELVNHYQLRDIMQAENRQITLTQKGASPEPLKFAWPDRALILDEVHDVDDYPDAKIQLRIWRHDAKDESPLSLERRMTGLLIKGDKAIYENTFFGHDSRSAARWFSGECRIPYLDELARLHDDNDDRPNRKNPTGIIRRNREGLTENHPFYQALQAQVEPILARLIEQEEKRAEKAAAKVSDRLSRDLGQLGKELARMFAEDTEDTDEKLPNESDGSRPVGLITIIPGRVVLYMGETKIISAAVDESVRANRIRVGILPDGIVEVQEGSSQKLTNRRTTLHLRPLQVGEGVLTIRAGNETETVVFEVRAERPAPPPPPTKLEFEYDGYSVKQGRTRRLKLQAPEEVVFENGDRVNISVKGTAIVKKGGHLEMTPNEDGVFECHITVEGRESSGSVDITACVGDTRAMTIARISKPSDRQGESFHFDLVNDSAGSFRAEIIRNVVKIWGRHPAVTKLIGSGPKFALQNEPVGRAAIAEIIASELTRKVVEAKFKGKEIDAAALYHEHRELLNRYLKKCQAVLLRRQMDLH